MATYIRQIGDQLICARYELRWIRVSTPRWMDGDEIGPGTRLFVFLRRRRLIALRVLARADA